MVAQALTSDNRHTPQHPCPLCGGYDRLRRHDGIRCAGWTDGDFVYCQRPQLAGSAPYLADADVYRHRVGGTCLCGVMHGPPTRYDRPARARVAPTPIRAHEPKAPPEPLTLTDTYVYRDGAARPVMEVLRYVTASGDKTFRQRRPDGRGGYVWNLTGVALVPYHADELVTETGERPVFVCEGEKDVDQLRALGLAATCNPMGAGKWRAEFGSYVAGLPVVILPDNDPPGRAHGEQVASSLAGVAASVKVLILPGLPERGDVSDWLNAGHSMTELLTWAGVWPAWQASVDTPVNPNVETAPVSITAGKRPCCKAGDCCRWRAAVTGMARNPATRGDLAEHVYVHDWLRRREAAGYSNEGQVRVSSTYKAKEAGCSPTTFRAHLQAMAALGVLAWLKVARHRGETKRDGTIYTAPTTETFVIVPGGAAGYLTRAAALTANEDAPAPRKVRPAEPRCQSCGESAVLALCQACGDVQDGAPMDADALFGEPESTPDAVVKTFTLRESDVGSHIRYEADRSLSTVNTAPVSGGATDEGSQDTAEQTYTTQPSLDRCGKDDEKTEIGGLTADRAPVSRAGGDAGASLGVAGLPHARRAPLPGGVPRPRDGETGVSAAADRTENGRGPAPPGTGGVAGGALRGAGDCGALSPPGGLAGRRAAAEREGGR